MDEESEDDTWEYGTSSDDNKTSSLKGNGELLLALTTNTETTKEEPQSENLSSNKQKEADSSSQDQQPRKESTPMEVQDSFIPSNQNKNGIDEQHISKLQSSEISDTEETSNVEDKKPATMDDAQPKSNINDNEKASNMDDQIKIEKPEDINTSETSNKPSNLVTLENLSMSSEQRETDSLSQDREAQESTPMEIQDPSMPSNQIKNEDGIEEQGISELQSSEIGDTEETSNIDDKEQTSMMNNEPTSNIEDKKPATMDDIPPKSNINDNENALNIDDHQQIDQNQSTSNSLDENPMQIDQNQIDDEHSMQIDNKVSASKTNGKQSSKMENNQSTSNIDKENPKKENKDVAPKLHDVDPSTHAAQQIESFDEGSDDHTGKDGTSSNGNQTSSSLEGNGELIPLTAIIEPRPETSEEQPPSDQIEKPDINTTEMSTKPSNLDTLENLSMSGEQRETDSLFQEAQEESTPMEVQDPSMPSNQTKNEDGIEEQGISELQSSEIGDTEEISNIDNKEKTSMVNNEATMDDTQPKSNVR